MASLAERIIKYMLARNYKISTGTRQYNIVYVEGMNADGRLNADLPNCFNDRRMIIQVLDDKPAIIGNWEATTEPGSHYTDYPMNPKGAARIAFGQYKAWVLGMHGRAKSMHEALVQVAPIRIHRDFNKDGLRTGDRLYASIFAINQHCGYDLPLNNIANASAGCLVGRTTAGHQEFMQLVKRDIRYETNRSCLFTTTVIAGDDLLRAT